jgi:hypothetical protein
MSSNGIRTFGAIVLFDGREVAWFYFIRILSHSNLPVGDFVGLLSNAKVVDWLNVSMDETFDVLRNDGEILARILVEVIAKSSPERVRPFVKYVVDHLQQCVSSWRSLKPLSQVIHSFVSNHWASSLEFGPEIVLFLNTFYTQTTGQIPLSNVDLSSLFNALQYIPCEGFMDFATEFFKQVTESTVHESHFAPAMHACEGRGDRMTMLRNPERAVFAMPQPEGRCLALFTELPPLVGWQRAETLTKTQYLLRPFQDKPTAASERVVNEAAEFLGAAVSFLERNLNGNAMRIIRVVGWLKRRIRDQRMGNLGNLLFGNSAAGPNFELIELMRILDLAVGPNEIREFFVRNQERCLGILRPTEFDIPARLCCYLKVFPFLEVFDSSECENCVREILTSGLVPAVRSLPAEIATVCWRTPVLVFSCEELFSHLIQFPVAKETSNLIIEAFLLNPQPERVVEFVAAVQARDGFTFSRALEERIEVVADHLFGMNDAEFDVLFECCAQTTEFTEKVLDAAVPAVAQKGTPSGIALLRVVRLIGLVRDGEVRAGHYMMVVLMVADMKEIWKEEVRVPAVDELLRVMEREMCTGWAPLLCAELRELEEEPGGSFGDLLRMYVKGMAAEEMRMRFEEAWEESRGGGRSAEWFVALAMREREDCRTIAERLAKE